MATLSINDLSQNSGDVIITGTSDAENSQVLLEYDGDYYTGGVVGGEFFAPSNPTVIANNVTNASSQLVDNDAYCAEPHLWRLNNGNHIKVFWRGGSHVQNEGRIVQQISTDGMATWGAESTVVGLVADRDIRNIGGRVDPTTGNIIIFYSEYALPGGVRGGAHLVYSTDNGATYSAPADYTATIGQGTNVVPFGNFIETANGLMQAFYYHTYSVVLFSTDGVTWGSPVTIYSGYSPSNGIGEPALVRIDDNRAVAVMRSNTNIGSFVYSKTSDGGLTWTALSAEYAYTGATLTAASPYFGKLISNHVFSVWTPRKPTDQVWCSRLDKDAFFAAPEDAWVDNPTAKLVASTPVSTAPINMGYPTALELEDEKCTVVVAWYQQSSDTGTNYTDIVSQTAPRF